MKKILAWFIKGQISPLLLIIGILCIIGFFLLRSTKEDNQGITDNGLLSKIPSFSVDSISGSKVNQKSLTGNVSFVQFVDGRNDVDINLFQTVHEAWGKKGLKIVLIVSHLDNFTRIIDEASVRDVQIINRNIDKELDRSFRVGPKEHKYFIYDEKGILRDSGYTFNGYEGGPKTELKKLINGEELSLSSLLPKGRNISDFRWLSMIDGIIKSQKRNKYIFSLFTSICRGCYSGYILDLINEASQAASEDVLVAGILNQRFNTIEIKALRSQLQVELPMFIADDDLNEKWNSLINEYREGDLNNIIVIIDGNGKITHLIDQKCNCLGELRKILKNVKDNTL